ncbi:hypothetical protein [Rhizobium mongolense]|uniref:Uncharacterized protein n=1 Tax=Rhizobium mongolense TaxID=57676 RepID=A0A7W6RKD7_9HYPH|nr:hypothetical protein [Rhizobium mongolense]MBB4274093.1 hypothetical protein [Rhizobium mongolense]
MLQIEYVRGFEDRISPYPDLQAWLKRQCSKAFSYEETVLQCIFALEYGRMYREQRTDALYVWELLLAEAESLLAVGLDLRCPSYSTFRKRVRDLDAALQFVSSAL